MKQFDVLEDNEDAILGSVKVVVHLTNDGHLIRMTMTRKSDQTTFISTRKSNEIIYVAIFTLSDNRKTSVIRYYNTL